MSLEKKRKKFFWGGKANQLDRNESSPGKGGSRSRASTAKREEETLAGKIAWSVLSDHEREKGELGARGRFAEREGGGPVASRAAATGESRGEDNAREVAQRTSRGSKTFKNP